MGTLQSGIGPITVSWKYFTPNTQVALKWKWIEYVLSFTLLIFTDLLCSIYYQYHCPLNRNCKRETTRCLILFWSLRQCLAHCGASIIFSSSLHPFRSKLLVKNN